MHYHSIWTLSVVGLLKRALFNCEDFADGFIKDIITVSETWYDPFEHIRNILVGLRTTRLTAKPSECMLTFQQIEFLAYIVDNGEVQTTKTKIEAIQNIPTPTTKKQVCFFI